MKRKHYFLVIPTGVIALVVLFVMLLSVSVVPIAHAATTVKLYTKASSVSVYSGSTFSLQVRLLKSTDDWVNYVDARLSYNPSVLSVVGTSASGSVFRNDGGPTILYSNSTGTLSITGTSADYVPTPSDSLVATVTFRAKTAAKTSVSMTSQSQAGRLVGQTNVKNYLTSTAGTSVTITSPPVVAAPTSPSVSDPVVNPTTPTTGTTTPDKSDTTDDTATNDQQVSVNTEPDAASEEQVAVPVIAQDATESSDDTESAATTGWLNWLYWLIGGVGAVGLTVGAALVARRRAARLQYEDEVLHKEFALGGTAYYAAEYLEPERLSQRVFETSLSSPSEEVTGVAVNEPAVVVSDPIVESVETVRQTHYDDAEQLSIVKKPSAISPAVHHVAVPRRRKLHGRAV